MVFSNKHTPHKFKPFTLNSQPLEFVTHFKYLGVQLQANGRWDSQYEHVRGKLLKWAYRIGNIIVPERDTPSPMIVRALVLSYMFSSLSYGLAFWRPTKQQLDSLQTIILKPLRRVLHLSCATPVLAVCAEFNIPTVEQLRDSLVLAAAQRLHHLPNTNPAAVNFRAGYLRGRERAPGFAKPFHVEVGLVEKLWRVSHHTVDNINQRAVQRTRARFSNTDHKRTATLRQLRTSESAAVYLLSEPRHISAIRARLRFGIARVNVVLFKHKLSATDQCLHCGQLDSIDHVLLHCKQFDREREVCHKGLAAIGVPLGLEALLAGDEFCGNCLPITSQFLSHINSLRQL
jgi:hypothetical protein